MVQTTGKRWYRVIKYCQIYCQFTDDNASCTGNMHTSLSLVFDIVVAHSFNMYETLALFKDLSIEIGGTKGPRGSVSARGA